MSLRILIVDVYEAHRKVMAGFIRHIRPDAEVHQFDPSIAGKPHAEFDWVSYELIVMDSRLGEEDGLEWFRDYSASIEDFPPVVFLSSQNTVDIAVKAMKLGARDFIAKKGIQQSRLKEALLDVLPELPPRADLMPDLKPLPSHHDTMQYGGADTQIISPPAGVTSPSPSVVEEVTGDVDEYWDEQTQILHAPPR